MEHETTTTINITSPNPLPPQPQKKKDKQNEFLPHQITKSSYNSRICVHTL